MNQDMKMKLKIIKENTIKEMSIIIFKNFRIVSQLKIPEDWKLSQDYDKIIEKIRGKNENLPFYCHLEPIKLPGCFSCLRRMAKISNRSINYTRDIKDNKNLNFELRKKKSKERQKIINYTNIYKVNEEKIKRQEVNINDIERNY